MPHWSFVLIGCLLTAAFVEVIRRTRKASRQQLADHLDRISGSLAELADDLDSDRASPAKYAELGAQLDDIRGVLGGNSLNYGVRHDLIVGLSEVHDEPSQSASGPARARRLTREVGEQLQSGSVEADKMRRVSHLFKGAARAMRAQAH